MGLQRWAGGNLTQELCGFRKTPKPQCSIPHFIIFVRPPLGYFWLWQFGQGFFFPPQKVFFFSYGWPVTHPQNMGVFNPRFFGGGPTGWGALPFFFLNWRGGFVPIWFFLSGGDFFIFCLKKTPWVCILWGGFFEGIFPYQLPIPNHPRYWGGHSQGGKGLGMERLIGENNGAFFFSFFLCGGGGGQFFNILTKQLLGIPRFAGFRLFFFFQKKGGDNGKKNNFIFGLFLSACPPQTNKCGVFFGCFSKTFLGGGKQKKNPIFSC